MDKYIGRLLDNRYEILEVIGTGGMAVVYKARCHRLNRLVAIKILKDDYLEDEEFRRRFHSESQAVAMLSHPNIVSIYDVSSSITADYIVMELIDGITLKQYMEKKGVLNWKETLHFAIQISKALEHAHSRGIVHRDIKPHNVMVLKNGAVKVTDFGIARMMSKGNTLTKEALGSVHYISPEQAKGGRVDSRSDIYSLGVVMYEMMSGRPPYDGESPVAVAIQHINGGAVMPSTLNPNIPGGLEQIIMKAMAHEPGERYASATQMLSDMDEFRKSPAILFDYNTPPIDAVTNLPKPPLVLETPKKQTTADRVAGAEEGNRRPARKTPEANSGNRQRPARRRSNAEEEEKRSKAATIAIITCSAVMVVAVVIFLVVLLNGGMNPKVEMINVPDLLGKIYDELPEYADFSIKIDKKVHDEKTLAGEIIDQEPAAGEQIEKNKTIYVTVSLGKETTSVFMPDVVDWELSQAEKALNNLDLKLQFEIMQEHHDTIASGNVIRTEPAAQQELEEDQTITLYVSKGIEIKNGFMPSLVGDTKDVAEKILNDQELALEIAVEEIFDSVAAVGEVVRTEPASGESLQTGQKVTIYVSKGPQLVVIKEVIGLQVDSAVSILQNDGFTCSIATVESAEDKGTVVGLKTDDKEIKPGDSVDVNFKIIIEVSKGMSSTPMVTKDVTISLRGSTAVGECLVVISREDTELFRQVVPMGQDSVVLEGQTGTGTVYYEVIVADSEGWIQKESFDADAG